MIGHSTQVSRGRRVLRMLVLAAAFAVACVGGFYVQLAAAAQAVGCDIESLHRAPTEVRLAAWLLALAFFVATCINPHLIINLLKEIQR